MRVCFHKYQGTGNDFILIDNREEQHSFSIEHIRKLCDRRLGIGADGMILIQNHADKPDYKMIYFNSDGSQSLCANGSRCGFSFAQSLGIVQSSALFETTDGIHRIKEEGGMVHFQLSDTKKPSPIYAQQWYVDNGSPHHIVEVDDLNAEDVVSKGREIRQSERYREQNGTNVNFVHFLVGEIKMRTYERGVENETLSCGTGAVAVALTAGEKGWKSPVTIDTLGGPLQVYFKKEDDHYSHVWIAGPTKKVFEGTVII